MFILSRTDVRQWLLGKVKYILMFTGYRSFWFGILRPVHTNMNVQCDFTCDFVYLCHYKNYNNNNKQLRPADGLNTIMQIRSLTVGGWHLWNSKNATVQGQRWDSQTVFTCGRPDFCIHKQQTKELLPVSFSSETTKLVSQWNGKEIRIMSLQKQICCI